MPITHEWNGTVLTITSDSGSSSCDLKGEKGDDGARGPQGIAGDCVATDTPMLGGIAAAEYALKTDTVANAEQLGGVAAGEYATKDYVDTEVSNVEIDLSPYATKDYVEKKVSAYNLLDNSDFRNPVNQRGQTEYAGNNYTIDRWRNRGSNMKISINNGFCKCETTLGSTYAGIKQFVANIEQYKGKTLTFAVEVQSNVIPRIQYSISGTQTGTVIRGTAGTKQVLALSFVVPDNATENTFAVEIVSQSTTIGDYVDIYWACLYEGQYTAETLPPYVPKGYAVELAECMRYYQKYKVNNTNILTYGYCYSATSARFTMLINPMRARPTVSFITPTAYVPYVLCNGVNVAEGELTFSTSYNVGTQIIEFIITVEGGTKDMPAMLCTNAGAYLELSADL